MDINILSKARRASTHRAAILVAIFGFTLVGSAARAEPTGVASPDQQAAASPQGDRSGARLAQNTCLQCHGTGVGPDLRQQQLNFDTIRYVTRNGLNAMPSFREGEISDAELREVADYLASLRVPAGQTPGVVPGSVQSREQH